MNRQIKSNAKGRSNVCIRTYYVIGIVILIKHDTSAFCISNLILQTAHYWSTLITLQQPSVALFLDLRFPKKVAIIAASRRLIIYVDLSQIFYP